MKAASGDAFEVLPRGSFGGSFPEALLQLQDDLNFTARMLRRQDRGWGGLNEQGEWTGMVSSLVKGEADLVAASLTNSYYRWWCSTFIICVCCQRILPMQGLRCGLPARSGN